MSNVLLQFEKQQYLNIESFRKNGQGVKTPVWFAQEGNTLHIWTQADSGKIKRIRRDGSVRINPSTASGEPLGEWVDVHAAIFDSTEDIKRTESLFRKKYGWMFSMIGGLAKLRGAKYATIRLQLL